MLDEESDVREAAAESLATLGQPGWQECIHGNGEDWRRLAASKDARVVAILVGVLTNSRWQSRRAAAEGLRYMARTCPSLLAERWGRIAGLVSAVHADRHSDTEASWNMPNYGDTDIPAHSDHSDIGIGESFPARPPELDF